MKQRQKEANDNFNQAFPHGYELLPTSGEGLLCGVRAIAGSINRQIDAPKPDLTDLKAILRDPRVKAFEAALGGNERKNEENFFVDQLAVILQIWGEQQDPPLQLQLGLALGETRQLISCPHENPTSVWIFHSGAPSSGHYNGMAPKKKEPTTTATTGEPSADPPLRPVLPAAADPPSDKQKVDGSGVDHSATTYFFAREAPTIPPPADWEYEDEEDKKYWFLKRAPFKHQRLSPHNTDSELSNPDEELEASTDEGSFGWYTDHHEKATKLLEAARKCQGSGDDALAEIRQAIQDFTAQLDEQEKALARTFQEIKIAEEADEPKHHLKHLKSVAGQQGNWSLELKNKLEAARLEEEGALLGVEAAQKEVDKWKAELQEQEERRARKRAYQDRRNRQREEIRAGRRAAEEALKKRQKQQDEDELRREQEDEEQRKKRSGRARQNRADFRTKHGGVKGQLRRKMPKQFSDEETVTEGEVSSSDSSGSGSEDDDDLGEMFGLSRRWPLRLKNDPYPLDFDPWAVNADTISLEEVQEAVKFLEERRNLLLNQMRENQQRFRTVEDDITSIWKEILKDRENQELKAQYAQKIKESAAITEGNKLPIKHNEILSIKLGRLRKIQKQILKKRAKPGPGAETRTRPKIQGQLPQETLVRQLGTEHRQLVNALTELEKAQLQIKSKEADVIKLKDQLERETKASADAKKNTKLTKAQLKKSEDDLKAQKAKLKASQDELKAQSEEIKRLEVGAKKQAEKVRRAEQYLERRIFDAEVALKQRENDLKAAELVAEAKQIEAIARIAEAEEREKARVQAEEENQKRLDERATAAALRSAEAQRRADELATQEKTAESESKAFEARKNSLELRNEAIAARADALNELERRLITQQATLNERERALADRERQAATRSTEARARADRLNATEQELAETRGKLLARLAELDSELGKGRGLDGRDERESRLIAREIELQNRLQETEQLGASYRHLIADLETAKAAAPAEPAETEGQTLWQRFSARDWVGSALSSSISLTGIWNAIDNGRALQSLFGTPVMNGGYNNFSTTFIFSFPGLIGTLGGVGWLMLIMFPFLKK